MPRAAADIMWAQAIAMLARQDRLHQDFFRPATVGWEPPVDLLETAEDLIMIVALPGVRPDEVEIRAGGGELTIVGIRRMPASLRGAYVHRMELPQGHFERRLFLPQGQNFELTRHDLVDGCLTVILRKLG